MPETHQMMNPFSASPKHSMTSRCPPLPHCFAVLHQQKLISLDANPFVSLNDASFVASFSDDPNDPVGPTNCLSAMDPKKNQERTQASSICVREKCLNFGSNCNSQVVVPYLISNS
jgi:hypothetical protein